MQGDDLRHGGHRIQGARRARELVRGAGPDQRPREGADGREEEGLLRPGPRRKRPGQHRSHRLQRRQDRARARQLRGRQDRARAGEGRPGRRGRRGHRGAEDRSAAAGSRHAPAVPEEGRARARADRSAGRNGSADAGHGRAAEGLGLPGRQGRRRRCERDRPVDRHRRVGARRGDLSVTSDHGPIQQRPHGVSARAIDHADPSRQQRPRGGHDPSDQPAQLGGNGHEPAQVRQGGAEPGQGRQAGAGVDRRGDRDQRRRRAEAGPGEDARGRPAAHAGISVRHDWRFRLRRQLRAPHPGEPGSVPQHDQLAGAAGKPDLDPAEAAQRQPPDDDGAQQTTAALWMSLLVIPAIVFGTGVYTWWRKR